ncbi:MAG: matrixin family metalloprotease, partial [Deltaproteobacteria bacterium]|nr:matrixin family metalloprotease [Deltaproteobacteria bacterium]
GDSCWSDADCNNRYDCWQYTAATIGLTTTTYDRKTGQIYDADMELNAANFKMTTADAPPCAAGILNNCVSSDIQNTVTHEVGHLLGLDHAPDPQSTMFASAPTGETSKRSLDDDSRAFVCEVYPAGQDSRDCVLVPVEEALGPRASCSMVGGRGAWPWLVLGLLGAAARRRVGR